MTIPERDPTPREVLIALNAHVQACALFQRINLAFIAAVLAVLVTFSGYTYTQNQKLQEQQLVAVARATSAANQTKAVAETIGAPITPQVAPKEAQ